MTFKEKLNNFWEPMRGEMRKSQVLVNFIGSLGVFPAVMLARKVDTIWFLFGIIILWWFIVVMIYLTVLYYKNNKQL